jgi:DNA polymerase elongation subunit (family B)
MERTNKEIQRKEMKKNNGPRILIFDIETAPLLSRTWGIWDQNVGLNQIVKDWHLLSFAAKWLGDPPSKVIYADQRNVKNIEDDKEILKKLWKLLDEADIVVGQNSKSFDHKKVNARFIFHGMTPPSSFRIIDTKVLAKKHFAFTSNSLEYLTKHLQTKYKKLVDRKKFSGFSLWTECLKGNKEAFKQMKEYNILDVLSTELLYKKLIPWESSINFSVYSPEEVHICSCGSTESNKIGFGYTSSGKFQRYRCTSCGRESRSRINLLSKEKRKSLKGRA